LRYVRAHAFKVSNALLAANRLLETAASGFECSVQAAEDHRAA
jgi:hypothetical protein